MKRVFLVASSLLTAACVSSRAAPPPVVAHAPPERGVYRLDFVLAARDAAGATRDTAFTLDLEEGNKGEVVVGRNIPLSTGTNPSAARRDVGLRVQARCFARGDDLVLDVDTEVSSSEPPSDIRKIVARGNALARPGRSTLVASVDDDGKHYQLNVTPTKLR